MKSVFTIGFVLLFTFSAFSQILSYRQGELLVQIELDASIYDIVSDFQKFEGEETNLKVLQQVVRSSRIWLLGFDFTRVDQRLLSHALRQHPAITVVQNNHNVFDRGNTPNDPNFSSQWHHVNIESEDAWDITTGGETALGDEIVVAVLDDGINLTHPDLAANLWINVNEIAGNGIDNDGNGYIDDIYGWNALNNTPNVGVGGSHGTPVSGMIGAVGNNNIGIVGANWDVKIMTIRRGGVSEAAVLNAYEYPLVMRRLYNQTNGLIGAFVVATNASWGIDNGQPSNAPLWCAFYDTLGLEGILNCGATTNSNLNVDIVGDLPTACPSDFMIGVTATNNLDIRTFSGYGLTTIDLGAPGASVVTTNNQGGNSATSGTSFASPLTAGVIALMYSAPCPNIIALAKSDPPQAALLMKQYLLDNVDETPQLLLETVSGGRLNSYKSVLAVMQNCSDCPDPYSVEAITVDLTSATINWTQMSELDTVNLRYRVVGSTEWTLMDNVSAPFSFTGLLACTDYEFGFQPVCADLDTLYDFGLTYTLKTDGCCDLPSGIVLAYVDSNSLSFTWGDVTAAANYIVEIREAGTSEWTVVEITPGDDYVVSGLQGCTDYEYRIYTACDTANSEITDILSIKTKGCGACIDNVYCSHEGGSTVDEWIANVTLGDINNSSGASNGYMDYTGQFITDLAINETYQISISPGFSGTNYNQVYRVWIDYNQNGVFEANEIVYGNTTPTMQPVSGSFTVPENAMLGITRMRVAMRYNSAPPPCGEYAFGEVEDYCVNIVQGFVCPVPEELSLVSADLSSLNLLWNNNSIAESYTIEYREIGTGSWTTVSTTDNSINLIDLKDCTAYNVRIRSNCESPYQSVFTPIQSFTTECYDCVEVTGINALEIDTTSAEIVWNEVEFATIYRVQYRAVGASSWTVINTTNTFAALANLTECTDYEVRVRTTCSNSFSEYTQEFTFKTACITTTNLPAELSGINIFPVPANKFVNIELSLENATSIKLELWSINGQRILSRNHQMLYPGSHTLTIDQSEIPANGVYFARITTEKGSWTGRIVFL